MPEYADVSLDASTVRRFWKKVQKSDGCWLWTASQGKGGYGKADVAGKTTKAHRLSWRIHNGAIPAGKDVLHTCDNPPCVRPDHLYLGTDIENTKDKMARGRQSAPRMYGDTNPHAVLTWSRVDYIRNRLSHGATVNALARELQMQPSTVSRIKNNKRWQEAHRGGI